MYFAANYKRMDKKLMLSQAHKLGLPVSDKTLDRLPENAVFLERSQVGSDPATVIGIYQQAISEGATWEDCNASALYYYGMPYNTLMAVCWCMIALG